jgi:hypothetical protein
MRTNRKHCLCTGMLYDPAKQENTDPIPEKRLSVYGRWLRFKQFVFLKGNKKNTDPKDDGKKGPRNFLKSLFAALFA